MPPGCPRGEKAMSGAVVDALIGLAFGASLAGIIVYGKRLYDLLNRGNDGR
jgi:hypothetical protein